MSEPTPPAAAPTGIYLIDLASRLARGCAAISPDAADRHAAFVLAQRRDDGGYGGRATEHEAGESDLYYTSFALRSLAMLGRLGGETDATARFLQDADPLACDVIDLMNWLASALAIQSAGGPDLVGDRAATLAEAVAARLAAHRTSDGGFSKEPGGRTGSMYASFLAVLAHQLVGLAVPDPASLVAFVLDRQRDDGGFVEIAPMKRSGTNPTAAAAAILRIHGAHNRVHPDDLRDFLADVRTEGGLAANTRVPLADGLSTFTGLLTDRDWGLAALSPTAVRGFVAEQLELPAGGFRAAGWDDTADVEYTFYGLGCLALCSEE